MSEAPTSCPPRRFLLLAGSEAAAAEWRTRLQEWGQVRIVTTLTEAQTALGEEAFDAVLCPGSELLPLGAALGRDQSRAILEGIAQGVCSVGRDGGLIWTNTALRTYPPEVVETVRAACAASVPAFEADRELRSHQQTFSTGQKQFFELTISALRDAQGAVDRVVGFVSDTTSLAALREKLDAIDAAGRQLVALEADAASGLEVPERLRLLEDNLIRYCRDLLDFTHFNVLVLDPQTRRLETVLAGGFSEEAARATIYAEKEGNGISGYVAATGESYICADISKDPLYLAGIEHARSSLTVPLRLNKQVVGVLNVESDQPAAFSDEDRQVAEIFGRYIAVALQMLKLLVVERSETTDQLTADVRAELSQPLNDIVSQATHLLQHQPSPEDAQQRLRAIIAQVDRVQEALQRLAEPRAIRGLAPEVSAFTRVLRGKRVLVADDEDIIRETIADVLSKTGALPIMARDGDEAVAMIQSQRFDLVLSDIKMPYKNGYEVFAAAREAGTHCPVILITGFGYDPEHSIVRASREGLAGVLFKPFKVEQLLELMEKAVTSGAGP